MDMLVHTRVHQCTGPDLWEQGISSNGSITLLRQFLGVSGGWLLQETGSWGVASAERQGHGEQGLGVARNEGWPAQSPWGEEKDAAWRVSVAPGRQRRCLHVSEQGGLPLPPGPGERRRNKSLHFDGSSSPISSIYSVSIAGAEQQPWQQLPPGSHLLLGCALPSRKENEEGDRERERKRESEGGRVGKEKGKKPCWHGA